MKSMAQALNNRSEVWSFIGTAHQRILKLEGYWWFGAFVLAAILFGLKEYS